MSYKLKLIQKITSHNHYHLYPTIYKGARDSTPYYNQSQWKESLNLGQVIEIQILGTTYCEFQNQIKL